MEQIIKKEIIAQGAEAILIKEDSFLIKNRIKKGYRNEKLDEKIRKKRTRHEARIIEGASKLIEVPRIFEVNEESIKMSFIEGKRLSDYLDKLGIKEQKEICKNMALSISKLHENNIIHGDLTTSNMIWRKENNKNKLYFIDFGLAFHSNRIEDKAVDIHLLKQSLESKHFRISNFLIKNFLEHYKWKDSEKVLKQLKKVESRGRYKKLEI